MGRFFDVDLEQAETADMEVTLSENVRFKLKIAGSKSQAYANAMTQARVLAKRIAKRHGSEVLSYEDQRKWSSSASRASSSAGMESRCRSRRPRPMRC
ncbi:MAG: hypothetical protein IPG28_12840 [Betaproteobacteria bacterium]|nr:hypothetical protein [Betaproteobacteria bacterium]